MNTCYQVRQVAPTEGAVGVSIRQWPRRWRYGLATSSRLLKIIGLFCKRALQKRLYSAKETCNFKEPTNSSHTIYLCGTHVCQRGMAHMCVWENVCHIVCTRKKLPHCMYERMCATCATFHNDSDVALYLHGTHVCRRDIVHMCVRENVCHMCHVSQWQRSARPNQSCMFPYR